MARIIPGSLGTPQGKTGNEVFRRTNKKTFSYRLTKAYNDTKSEKVKEGRKKFGQLSKFSNYLNESPLLKDVWIKSKLKGHGPNRKILKYNHAAYMRNGISHYINILPVSLYMHKTEVELTNDYLNMKLSAIDQGANILDEKYKDFNPPYVFMAIIHAKDPVDPDSEHKYVNARLEETLDKVRIADSGHISFTFDTEKGFFSFVNHFNTVIVFPAVVSIDEFNKPLKWTECGGIYLKGNPPPVVRPEKPKPLELPGKKFEVKYF